ncbi:PREDICTED: uncharacterized protein C9orf50 homolog [Chinchilla lanigera]|uniref:uncharacterized protein C9orf50 homolog n=1 Tax=Chinchilla lanigera TaxID=34839 RepID=UPI00038EECF7|nr:PREDICTED: uncharacterized protein C9orf50 homolog [Chinchilla lanigera]
MGALLGELLPCKFREFLAQLRAKCSEEPELQAQTPSAPKHQSGVSGSWRDSPQCPSCQFLPDLRDQLSDFQERLDKILRYQKSTLGPLRGDYSEFPTVKKDSPFCGTPGPEAMPTPTLSRGGLGPRRRSCPFRVRFADESLRDSALRYWERRCAVQQNMTATPPAESVPRMGLGSLGRWPDSLPKAESPRVKEDATASSACWAHPGLVTAVRLWRDLPGLLDTCSFLEQVGRSPSSWSQKPEPFLPDLVLQSVLKHGYPKGY